MEAYANALLYAIPFFVGLVLLEIGYGYFVKKQRHRPMDTISSLSSGITNIVKDSLGLVLVIISYPFLKDHLAFIEIESTWLVYIAGFIAIDFASYWNHRLSHKINFFWNQHVIHHSSEEFNLACALRQSISNLFRLFSFVINSRCHSWSAPQGNFGIGPLAFIWSILVPYQAYWKTWDFRIYYCHAISTSGTPCY